MRSKERLQQIIEGLTESEARFVWDIYASRPADEEATDALGRGLAEVFRGRRPKTSTTGER